VAVGNFKQASFRKSPIASLPCQVLFCKLSVDSCSHSPVLTCPSCLKCELRFLDDNLAFAMFRPADLLSFGDFPHPTLRRGVPYACKVPLFLVSRCQLYPPVTDFGLSCMSDGLLYSRKMADSPLESATSRYTRSLPRGQYYILMLEGGLFVPPTRQRNVPRYREHCGHASRMYIGREVGCQCVTSWWRVILTILTTMATSASS
jgi:hypothetical protein